MKDNIPYLAVIALLCVLLLHTCDATHDLQRELSSDYQAKLEDQYYRVSDIYVNSYWDLARQYDDLYHAYENDPGRTGSMDAFIDPLDLDLGLPDDYADFVK